MSLGSPHHTHNLHHNLTHQHMLNHQNHDKERVMNLANLKVGYAPVTRTHSLKVRDLELELKEQGCPQLLARYSVTNLSRLNYCGLLTTINIGYCYC